MRPAFMSFQWRVYKISCELVAEPSSSTHFSRSPNTAVLLSYLGQGVKTLRRLWYWNPWGSTYFGGVYVSFSTARFGSYILWNGCCCLTSESTGILPCRDPQWVVGNCSRFICIHLWDTCIRPRISRSSGRSLEITCCPGKIPLFCPVHTAVGRHLEAGHWTTHPPPSLLAMQWST